ncbi:hypothetical protein DPMN_096582 [Dreissena polymorpha]|uniref:Uncharacterized protein n=1 Tax=Dreissena polymorpha TaxID=45954 RepID=A0A9D4LA10_DREPO|nr:hypothetical protein DPMN_096582 [Dreissena polymorpha]
MTAPSTPEEWRQLADGFLNNWICGCLSSRGSTATAILTLYPLPLPLPIDGILLTYRISSHSNTVESE